MVSFNPLPPRNEFHDNMDLIVIELMDLVKALDDLQQKGSYCEYANTLKTSLEKLEWRHYNLTAWLMQAGAVALNSPPDHESDDDNETKPHEKGNDDEPPRCN